MSTPTMDPETPTTMSEATTGEAATAASSTPPPAAPSDGAAPETKHDWIEEIEVAGGQLVERVKELVSEGNVRRLIVRTPDDRVLIEIPLTAGIAVGGVVTIFAPVLAALGALAALIAHMKIQIIRADPPPDA